jgi:UDP-N-acetylmuramyl pentapeptide synthase
MARLLFRPIAFSTPENFNDELSVILSLSCLGSSPIDVIEDGIYHPGEMNALVNLLHLDLFITIGITMTHVANFEGSNQNVL